MTGNDADRSAGLWLLSFSAVAGAALCGRFSWLPALLGGILGALALRLHGRVGRIPAAVRAVQTIWLAVPLSVAANGVQALFPTEAQSLYVPAVVLGLSWLLCCHGRSGVLACCAIVGYFVLGALGIAAFCSVPDLRPEWLYPTFSWQQLLIALAIGSGGMLLTAAIPQIRPRPAWRWASALTPALLSALTAGVLSRPMAAREPSAFYALSRSVSLFGVAERFEALIAACLTLGACSACALLLSAARGKPRERALLAAAALALSRVNLPPVFAAAGTVVLWMIIPLLFYKKTVDKKALPWYYSLAREKNREKDKKSS